jgi:hypothetical protein
LLLGSSLLAGACSERVDGLKPVGGEETSAIQQERYVRRLYLDLTASPPTEAQTTEALTRLESNSGVAMRSTLADELLDTREFATTYVSELENRVFVGEQPEYRYQLLCLVYRTMDPSCTTCMEEPANGDQCSDCACPMVAALFAEREQLYSSVDDLQAGTSTGEIERRYGSAYAFQFYGTAETTTGALFRTFLGREPEADELRNAAMMVFPLGEGENPTGLLFHRHGRDYLDLVDIVFTSEAYREAVVQSVFLRYLGRTPTPVELSHFAGLIDESEPDARDVIRAVLSSREYFEQ